MSAFATAGVYTSLDDVIRPEHRTRGAFSFLPKQPVHGLLSGRHASRMRGRGLNFEELRGYLPGDDVRSIDWKVTARTGKTHVRVFTEERDRPAVLVVDQRLSMFFGTRLNMKSVTAAELAAAGAWRVLEVGDRVGAVVFDDAEIRDVRPHRSRRTVLEILNLLVEKNHALSAEPDARTDPAMLNQALEGVARVAEHDYLVAIISDFDGAEAEDRLLIVLTDGKDSGSKVPPGKAAESAAQNEITIHTVAVGDPESTGEGEVDLETLETVASATGGRAFRADDREQLEDIYREIDALDPVEVETTSYRPTRPLYHWPLSGALALLPAYHLMMTVLQAGRRIGARHA